DPMPSMVFFRGLHQHPGNETGAIVVATGKSAVRSGTVEYQAVRVMSGFEKIEAGGDGEKQAAFTLGRFLHTIQFLDNFIQIADFTADSIQNLCFCPHIESWIRKRGT